MSDSRTNLHISHSWGGGLGKWVSDFACSDPFSHNLVLECLGTKDCFGAGHRLLDARTRGLIEEWTLAAPISEVQQTNSTYAAHLRRIVDARQVTHIYVSSLTGHSLDVFNLDLPVTRVYHDFFPYCPALYCFRDSVCTRCGEGDLVECRAQRYNQPMNSPRFYLELRESLIGWYRQARVQHVVPSSSVWRRLCLLDPRHEELDVRVIEHGVDCARTDLFAGATDGRRLRVAILGHLQWLKGLHILRQHFERLRLVADFVLLGSGDSTPEFEHRWGVTAVYDYAHDELPGLLRHHRIDLAMFLSVVPESYSYTLSEVMAFGIPPVVTRLGSFADRVRHGENGWFLSLDGDAPLDTLLYLDRNREEIREVSNRVFHSPVRTTMEMIREYYGCRSMVGLHSDSPRIPGMN